MRKIQGEEKNTNNWRKFCTRPNDLNNKKSMAEDKVKVVNFNFKEKDKRKRIIK